MNIAQILLRGLVLILSAMSSYATADTYYYYDFSVCRSYSISNEPDANSTTYANYKNELLEQLAHGTIGNGWDVYEWHDETRSADREPIDQDHPKIARMHTDKPLIVWEKRSLNAFPLAGASYRAVESKHYFECIKNCRPSVPAVLYLERYEPEEGDPWYGESQHERGRFLKHCKRE